MATYETKFKIVQEESRRRIPGIYGGGLVYWAGETRRQSQKHRISVVGVCIKFKVGLQVKIDQM